MPTITPTLKSAKDIMPAETAALFAEIQGNSLLNPFILIGGTALSLHIGHRVSEDLEFITLLPKLPRPALKQLERELENNGHRITHQINPVAYDDFQNAGLELSDSSQDWIVDNSVKLTFFSAESSHAKILTQSSSGTIRDHGFKIATLQELCQLKAIVTASRSKSRDWLDLFIVEQEHLFGLAKRLNLSDDEIAAMSLVNEDRELEELLSKLSGRTLEVDYSKDHLTNRIETLIA